MFKVGQINGTFWLRNSDIILERKTFPNFPLVGFLLWRLLTVAEIFSKIGLFVRLKWKVLILCTGWAYGIITREGLRGRALLWFIRAATAKKNPAMNVMKPPSRKSWNSKRFDRICVRVLCSCFLTRRSHVSAEHIDRSFLGDCSCFFKFASSSWLSQKPGFCSFRCRGCKTDTVRLGCDANKWNKTCSKCICYVPRTGFIES